MIVPTYVASAKTVTGVSGQPFGFKVPGGALSQGQVAEAQLYKQVSSDAASWGSTFYSMHRSSVISKEVLAATATLDAAAAEASKKDILSPDKAQTPSGWFAAQASKALSTAQVGTYDPITRSAITSAVGSLVGPRQRAVNKGSRVRIVSFQRGDFDTAEAAARKAAASFIPSNWNGDYDTLPPAGRTELDKLYNLRSKASGEGTISYAQAEEGERADLSALTALALSQRMVAAKTSDATEVLLKEVDSGKHWLNLTPKDRDKTAVKLDRQITRQLRSEAAGAKQAAIAAGKQEKRERGQNQSRFQVMILDAQRGKPGAVMPTIEQLGRANLEPTARRIAKDRDWWPYVARAGGVG